MEEPKSKAFYIKEIEELRLQNQVLQYRIDALENLHKERNSGTINEEKYNAVIENAPWGILVTIPGEQVLEANTIACDIFGYTLEELKAIKVTDLVLMDDAFNQFLAKRNVDIKAKGEVKGIRKNGERFPMEFSFSAFIDPETGKLHNSSIIIDISDRKKIQRLIHETNEVARIGGWELDLNSNELTWSELTRQIHEVEPGFKPELETAINFYKEGWSRNLIAELVLKAISDGLNWEAEVILVTATGKELWVKAQGKAEFELGKCRRIYGTFQDINNQKLFQIKEELQRSNYKALLENIPDRIYSTDMNLNLTSFNSSFYEDAARFTGIEPKVGQNLNTFSTGLAWEALEAFLKEVLRGYNSTKESAVILGDETYFFEINGSPILDDSQTQIGISVFSRDITSRKRKEALVIESREFYKSLFDNNPDAVYSLGLNGKILTGNIELLKLLEINEKDLPKFHFSDFIPKEELEVVSSYFENLKSGVPHEFRCSVITANGNLKIVDNRTVPVVVNGKVISVFGISKDVSLSLKIDAERKLVLESILDYFYVVDKDFNFTYVNDAVEKLLERGPLLGRNMFETFPVLMEGEFYHNLLLAKKTNKPVHFDYYAVELETWFDENFYPHPDGISVFFRSVDDKKKAERELIDQKELAESVISNIPIMISLISKEGKFLSVNKAWEKELGWSEQETVNSQDFLPSILPDEAVRNDVQNFIAKANGQWRDFDVVVRDGNTIHSSWTNIGLSDGRKIGIGQNITARKRFEESLKLSNERYQYVTQATFDAIWDSDLVNNNVYWGEGFTTLFGYDMHQMRAIEFVFKTYLHPTDADRIDASFKAAVESSDSNWSGKYRFRKADGNYAYVQDKAIFIRDDSGKAIRAIGAMQDISRQKEEEQRLKLLESVVTNSTDSILILKVNQKDRLQSKIVYSNDAFNKMSGYNSAEVLGKTLYFFEGKESDEAEFAKLNHALLNFIPVEIETIHYRNGGEAYWVYISIIPVSNANGQFTHWISIQRDTTGRKKREIEREELVKELTISNKELKQFSYITSHNMRSPLTNLMAISDLIDTSLIQDETTVQLINGFKASTINLNETLEDLIRILIIKENTEVEQEKIQFYDVYRHVIQSIDSTIKDSAALIHTNFSGAESVVFNKAYMESIFLNLITNSIKYAKKGKKPVIFIYSILFEDSIKLVFEDDGLGFNMEKVKNKVFGLYQKFHNHPDSKGIGLYMVQSQIASLGGSIEVESEVNQGAKFTITFRRKYD